MEDIKTEEFVAIRYSHQRYVDFFPLGGLDIQGATDVVVDTEMGEMLGRILCCRKMMESIKSDKAEIAEDAEKKKALRVLRAATAKDKEDHRNNEEFAKESARFCKERIAARNLVMNLVNVETTLDRNKIVFFFVAETRVDFRELVKDLVQRLRLRIELRQISARREAQMMGGIGVCGREFCCVHNILSHDRVSIRMAKEQGVAINPEKISGTCGRLMCCLAYEFENYTAVRSTMPHFGSMVQIDNKIGRVVGQSIITEEVIVEMQDGRTVNAPLANIGKSKREGSWE